MKKRIFVLVMLCSLLFAVTACGTDNTATPDVGENTDPVVDDTVEDWTDENGNKVLVLYDSWGESDSYGLYEFKMEVFPDTMIKSL